MPAMGKPMMRPPVPNNDDGQSPERRGPGRLMEDSENLEGFGASRRQSVRFGNASRRGGSR